MTKYLPYLLYGLLIGLHQLILRDLFSVFGVPINLPILLVAALSLYKSEIESVWAALFVALVAESGEPSLLGWNAAVICAIAVAVFRSRQKLNLDSIISRVGVIAGAALIFILFQAALEGLSAFGVRLLTYVLPSVLYTSLVAWVFFLIKDKKLTFKTMREMF